MLKRIVLAAAPALMLGACDMNVEMDGGEPTARFTEDGKLIKPNPREWVFVSASASSVRDSSMSPDGGAMMAENGEEGAADADEGQSQPEGRFDIIRIDPNAWARYRETGEFPEGTVFAMSFHSMHDKGMNAPRYWADQPRGMEVAVKDSARFEDGWAYFRFEGDATTAEAFPRERCFACHAERGAHDNVFTQLYEGFRAK